MVSGQVAEWIKQRKTGCILYTSPARNVRDNSLKVMAQMVLCEKGAQFSSCECVNCHNVKANSHPHLVLITDEDFDDRMKVLYSYPTPIIQFSEAHRISLARQTKLLIWLESIGRQRFVMLTSDSEHSVLPTIRSRSVVFTEIPRYRLSEEDEFKVTMFMQGLFSGKERFESITTPEDAKLFAYQLRQAIVGEIQNRLMKPPKRKLPGSDVELATLMKVLERYLKDPQMHNLKLLLSGFSMLPLQAMR